MKRKWNDLTLVIIILLIFYIGSFLLIRGIKDSKKAKIAQSRAQIEVLGRAITSYESACGPLTNTDTASIEKRIFGDNPKQAVFLDINAGESNSAGQYIDSWGTTFQIDLTNGSGMVIRSAGPNRSFGDADDIFKTFATAK
jgi:hypothetical protein